MDLFLDQNPVHLEKLGMECMLSEDANDWPQQILDELYHQVPYASEYAPKVVLRVVDSDRRYGLGQVELLNKMAINPRDDDTPAGLKGRQKALVPVIIQDGKLKPLDVLIYDGKVEPLTEDRLRKALFRPNLYEAIRERPGDVSLIEQLYPPHRQYGGARGPMMADVGAAGGIGKEGSADLGALAADGFRDAWRNAEKVTGRDIPRITKISDGVFQLEGIDKEASVSSTSLFDAILPTITRDQASEVLSKVGGDSSEAYSLVGALSKNAAAMSIVKKLTKVAASNVTTGEDYLRKIAGALIPNVMQISRIDSGFRIKVANTEAFIPDAQDIPRPAAVGALGGDMVSKVESDGTTTITTQPAVKQTLADLVIEVVNKFGVYKVKTQNENRELIGWVFPKIMDFDGTLLPMALFTNGSESAAQENIAGVAIAKTTDLIDVDPEGLGCFYYASPEGAIAFTPVNVTACEETPEGTGFHCNTTLGEKILVTKVPGLKMPTMIEEGHYGIPEECGFISFNNTIDLASSPDEFTKVGQARALPNAVRVCTDGITYTMQGDPIDKIASVTPTEFLGRDEVVFLGTCLGQDPIQFSQDLDNMHKHASQEMWFTAKPVTLMSERYSMGKAAAATHLSKLPPIRAYLLKEAALLEDPMAVDKILSVGFINPENVSIFAGYIPEFETVIRKLAELLVATRMGLHTVNEGALQRALVHLDKVVDGLKTLDAAPQA
jgi:hypothetical protein